MSEYIKKSDVIEAMEENSVMLKVFGANRKMIDGIMLCQDIADMEIVDIEDDDWIPVEKSLPEEKENPVTMDFYEYEVTFRSDNICDIRHYKFGRGHWWHGGAIVDKYVVAWRKLPKPYREKDE